MAATAGDAIRVLAQPEGMQTEECRTMRAIHVFGMASTLNSTSDGAAPAVAQPQYLNYFTDNKQTADFSRIWPLQIISARIAFDAIACYAEGC
jgi:hypothetical protein